MKPNQNDIASGIRAMLDKCAALEAENARLRGVIQRVLDGIYGKRGVYISSVHGGPACHHDVHASLECLRCATEVLADAIATQTGGEG
jgi:hypothetical protein